MRVLPTRPHIFDGVVAVVCDACGWLGLDGKSCPVCGEATRSTPDVIDELIEVTIDEGGAVEHVFAHTPLETHKVGALLRFPTPLHSESSGAEVQRIASDA